MANKREREESKSAKKRRKQKKEPKSTTKIDSSRVQSNDKKDNEHTTTTTIASPFQKKKLSLLVSLEPSSLSNTRQALETSMHSLLLKYSDGLGGVLLAFDNLQFDSDHSHGQILNEMPHIHYRVTCTAVIFFPNLKSNLVGAVNEVFPSHVGLLVYELFNASVSAEALRLAGYTFDKEMNEWSQSAEGDGGDCIVAKGDKMSFRVEKLHESNGLISLEGSQPSVISIF
jgi:hypothetical protein